MATAKSIESGLIQETATYISYLPDTVRINDQYDIWGVQIESIEYDADINTSLINLSYTIPQNIGVDVITNIKLGQKEGVLTNADVEIPLLMDLVMRHTIRVQEGVV